MINENGLLNIFPTAEASGSIVSFENGADGISMESLSVAIEPIQDLHGYDHPWPAGGGKNKFLTTMTTETKNAVTATVNADGTIPLTGTATAATIFAIGQFTFPVGTYFVSICPPGGSASTYRVYASWGANDIGAGLTRTFSQETTITFTLSIASGVNVSGLVCKPLICLDSESHTWEPYENICPISGRTGLSVYRTGKNLLPDVFPILPQSAVSVNKSNCFFVKAGTYVASFEGAQNMTSFRWCIYMFDENGNALLDAAHKPRNVFDNTGSYWRSGGDLAVSAKNSTGELTIIEDCYIRICVGLGNVTASSVVNNAMLELGSTATAHEPYQGNTYSVDWTTQAGTVYGGTDEVVGGSLESTYGMVDLGTLNWSMTDGNVFYNNSIANKKRKNQGVICSNYANPYNFNTSLDRMADKTVQNRTDTDVIYIKDSAYSDPAAFKAAMSGVQLVYELATPLTYQLTPQEVATLLRANRVWSDAGDISLVYHTQVDATPSSIDGLFINGEGLQADGWFLKWRKLAAPKPKTDYVSVWGRDGDIDLTESETDGQVFYENRELTMDMVYMGEDWTDAYSELLDMLHGKECAVQFSNDPYWYWAGRIIASLYEHKPHSLAMSGIMFPYKLSIAKITKSATVSGAIESNGVEVVLPSSRMRVSPKVTVVAGTGESVTLKWGTKTQTLSAGTYYVRGLKVGSDDVTIKVWGTGTVTFEYRKGML